MRRVLVVAVVVVCTVPAWAVTYSGSLSTAPDGGLLGTGKWFAGGSSISWVVSEPDGPTPETDFWTYSYTLTVPRGGISHFTLEVSDSFTADDVEAWSGHGALEGPQIYSADNGNPNMPGPLWAVKWDGVSDGNDVLSGTFTIVTERPPMWGDFYSKNGQAGGLGFNTVWNTGFTAADFDPTTPVGNGSVDFHVLVPDTGGRDGTSNVVPEPLTVIGTLLAVGGIAGYARRRMGRR